MSGPRRQSPNPPCWECGRATKTFKVQGWQNGRPIDKGWATACFNVAHCRSANRGGGEQPYPTMNEARQAYRKEPA